MLKLEKYGKNHQILEYFGRMRGGNMKLCEYENNLFDMTLLCNITEKNKKVVFRGKDYFVPLMWIYINTCLPEMVFPRIYKKHNKYLRLRRTLLYGTPYYYFTEAVVLSPYIYMHFGD
jgi:hypothetical protein